VSGPNQTRSLDDPGVRLRLVHEVRDDATAPIGLGHLDADAPVLLRDQSVYRINHAVHYGSWVWDLNRPMRVPPLSLVVIFPETRRALEKGNKRTGPAAEPSTNLTVNRDMLAPVTKRSKYRHPNGSARGRRTVRTSGEWCH
jgi:hypothetical protein